MALKVQVPFEQLLTIVKALTPLERARLRQELDESNPEKNKKDEYIQLLLKGPVYTDEELRVVDDNRKSITNWRTKS